MSASGDTVYLFRALLFTHPSPLRRVEKGASGEAKVGGTGRHTDDRINKEHRERTCVSASNVQQSLSLPLPLCPPGLQGRPTLKSLLSELMSDLALRKRAYAHKHTDTHTEKERERVTEMKRKA